MYSMKKRPSISPNKVRCAVAASWNVVGQNLFYLRTKSDLQSTTSNLPFLLLYCDQEISNILPLGISQSGSAVNHQHLNINQCDKNLNDRKHLWEKYIWFVLFWVFLFGPCPICQHGGRGVHDVLASLLRRCHVVHLYIQSVNINQ